MASALPLRVGAVIAASVAFVGHGVVAATQDESTPWDRVDTLELFGDEPALIDGQVPTAVELYEVDFRGTPQARARGSRASGRWTTRPPGA